MDDDQANEAALRTAKARRTVLENLLQKYGKQRVGKLVEGFETRRSGEDLAREFGVTRERIRQWKKLLGYEVTVYQVYPDLEFFTQKRGTS